jgi:hypothetical protein
MLLASSRAASAWTLRDGPAWSSAIPVSIMTIDDLGPSSPETTRMRPSLGPALIDLIVVQVHKESAHQWAEVRLPAANRAAAALRIATQIAWERCGGAPQYFDAWLARRGGGPPHDPEFLDCLAACIASECIGTPAEPAYHEHLKGFVAEHIWHLLTTENALTYGIPVRVEEPDWSATDSGGDGLAIYRADGTLVFRLWESKAHSRERAVRDVVNGACRQLNSRALRYLGRFSKVGQRLDDPELQKFYGRLLELWRGAAREAGAGISVATASDEISDCFGNYPNYWNFTYGDQRQGLVVTIEEYADFATLVRDELWKGL